jgi:hypothetical protein
MKLSPPASSSDLDAAREVARRLNHIATPTEPTRPLPDYAPLKGPRDGAFVPPRRPAPPAWEPTPAPVAAPADTAVPPSTPAPDARPEPVPSAAPPEITALHEESAAADSEIHAVLHPPVVDVAPPPPLVDTPPEPKHNVEVEAPPAPPSPAPSVVAAPPLPEPPRPVAAEPPPAPAPAEEVEEIEEDLEPHEPIASLEAAVAAPITWPEVVAGCLALAEAKGALVINPAGRVVAVAGDWPAPGAEAIAARLVPAMDKALKDAPTRSVSVPLGGLHLTAWRAPLAQGLVTVGFVADAPLRPDLRPAIDAAVKKGPEL